MKKSFQITLMAMGLSLGLVLTGCSSAQATEATSTPQTEEVVVDTQNAINVFGTVVADTTSEVRLQFPATVDTVNVKEGDRLKKGDTLITLNYDSYKNEIAKKEKEIASLEVELKAAENGLDPEVAKASNLRSEISRKQNTYDTSSDPSITKLKDQISSLQDNLVTAKQDYENQKALLEAGAASQKDVDTAEQAVKNVQNQINAANADIDKLKTQQKEELDTLKANLSSTNSSISSTQLDRQTKVETLRIRIETANLELNELKSKLNNSMLKNNLLMVTDNNCVVSSVNVKNGSPISANSEQPILTLINEDSLVITVDIPEAFINKIHIGSEADVSLYADSQNILKGKVSRISNTATVVNGETMVKADITIDGNKDVLRVGYEADVTIY